MRAKWLHRKPVDEVLATINRKSGTAHLDRRCKALDGIPEEKLRHIAFDPAKPPPMRWCRRCAGPVATARPATRSAQPA